MPEHSGPFAQIRCEVADFQEEFLVFNSACGTAFDLRQEVGSFRCLVILSN